MTKSWKIAFWVSTVLFTIAMLPGAYLDFIKFPEAIAIFQHLGYPAYFSVIIGVAKFLGIVGIWQNKVRFLREWAYAGFAFELIGAAISHMALGDGLAQAAPAIVFFVVLLISYVSFRKLGYGCHEVGMSDSKR